MLSAQPTVSIGGADSGAQELSMVASTFRTPRGSIVVAAMRQAELRLFDSRGRHLQSVGRKGRGPGEFPVLWRAYALRDSILGMDAAGIGQLFGPDGKFVRTIPRTSAFGRRLEVAGYFGDGATFGYFYPDPLERAPSGESAIDAMLVRVSASRTDSLRRVAAGTVNRRGTGEPTAVAYAARLQLAVFDNRFCESSSSDYIVRCYLADGKPQLEIRRPDARTAAITQSDRDRFFAGIDKANPDPRAAGYRREIRERTEFARVRPQIGRLVAGTTGELWVGSYDPAESVDGTLHPSPDSATTWQVYSATGDWLAQLRLPVRFRLFDAGRDWILGVRRDEDDVEFVELYRLTR
ncbi:MAG: hypothetical protein IT359_14160 [Gemmatimonadaceae bacterium]|nr:hypothetical protein [Gemmatimonadaceae bacterium]